jgi:hypothetical protein
MPLGKELWCEVCFQNYPDWYNACNVSEDIQIPNCVFTDSMRCTPSFEELVRIETGIPRLQADMIIDFEERLQRPSGLPENWRGRIITGMGCPKHFY